MWGNSSSLLNVSYWTCFSANTQLGSFPALFLHAPLAPAVVSLKAQARVKSQVIRAVTSLFGFCLVRSLQACDMSVTCFHYCAINKLRNRAKQLLTCLTERLTFSANMNLQALLRKLLDFRFRQNMSAWL